MTIMYLIGGVVALGLLAYSHGASQTGVILMTFNGFIQLALYCRLARPGQTAGRFMARVYEGQPTGLDRVSAPWSG